MKQIAILLTCFNRKAKTLACMGALYDCALPEGYTFDIFLLDDGSTDGTANAVKKNFPYINIIKGNGNLYWAGGMRKVWRYAKSQKKYDGYLLLNDDVVLAKQVLIDLIATDRYAIKNFGKQGVYVSATADVKSGEISYSGILVKKRLFTYSMTKLKPSNVPISCSLANANILLVTKYVEGVIGIFDDRYTHGIADYDYTLTVEKNGFPLLLCASIGGYCENDHARNWLSANSTLKQRIKYLYSPVGLAFKDNIYFLKKHFARQLPYYFVMYWLKTFVPSVWDKFR